MPRSPRPSPKKRARPGNKPLLPASVPEPPSSTDQPAPEALYSSQFSADELGLVDYLGAGDLSAEISMLRVAIRRVFATASATGRSDDTQENGNPSQARMEVLDKLGMASSRLAGLLRTQQSLTISRSDEISEALSAALAEVTKDLTLD